MTSLMHHRFNSLRYGRERSRRRTRSFVGSQGTDDDGGHGHALVGTGGLVPVELLVPRVDKRRRPIIKRARDVQREGLFRGHQDEIRAQRRVTNRPGTVYARATCFRSQKKAGKPYKVYLAINSSSGAVTDATCDCPAGTSGACSHILATVRLIALLKKKGFKEAPPELSCTELPQQWRRPRRQGIKATSLQNVDWRSPRQDGASVPISASVSDMCSKQDDEQEQLDSMHKLGEGLKKRGNHSFGSMLLAAKGPFVETRLGLAPVGSPLSYQQALLPGGF
ncbi:hypothetical protein MTO96_049753 [Rhipicephalus appendiculatus]